ncbi:hypothetical protein J3R30DRAFT_3417274 [Lentinula aciculospora]|uniref:Secreted protein n=1 Tax=Lentinula aciculospora TaxID=153920 RepID=A0A9W9DYK6_9AGAR|nr:hypothetical protein J3R30DRAFT_3417274 [Lentinula aciculospora]
MLSTVMKNILFFGTILSFGSDIICAWNKPEPNSRCTSVFLTLMPGCSFDNWSRYLCTEERGGGLTEWYLSGTNTMSSHIFVPESKSFEGSCLANNFLSFFI